MIPHRHVTVDEKLSFSTSAILFNVIFFCRVRFVAHVHIKHNNLKMN